MSNKEPERIDFKSTDRYPIFPNCDSLAQPEVIEKCFESALASFIKTNLENYDFSTPVALTDGLIIHLEINKEGKASLIQIENHTPAVKELLPEIQIAIEDCVDDLPTFTPAKKEGVA